LLEPFTRWRSVQAFKWFSLPSELETCAGRANKKEREIDKEREREVKKIEKERESE